MASIIEIVDEEDYSGLNEEVKHKRTISLIKKCKDLKGENVGLNPSCWLQPIQYLLQEALHKCFISNLTFIYF